MNRTLLVLALVVAGGAAAALPADISADAISRHVKFLASDELAGRANGTAGLERAGDYIVEQFKAAGLEPGDRDGDWRQPFELIAGLTVGTENRLSFDYQGRTVTLALGTSYYPLGAPANEDAGAASTRLDYLPVVFAGYGLLPPTPATTLRGSRPRKSVLIFSPSRRGEVPQPSQRPAEPRRHAGKAVAADESRARFDRRRDPVQLPTRRLSTVRAGSVRGGQAYVLRARRAEMAP